MTYLFKQEEFMDAFYTGMKTFVECQLSSAMPFLFQRESLSDEDIPEKIDQKTREIICLNRVNKQMKKIVNQFFDNFATKLFDAQNKLYTSGKANERINYETQNKRTFLIFWERIQKDRHKQRLSNCYGTEVDLTEGKPKKIVFPLPKGTIEEAKHSRKVQITEWLSEQNEQEVDNLEQTIVMYVQYCTDRGADPDLDVTAILSQPNRSAAKINYVQNCMKREEAINVKVLKKIQESPKQNDAAIPVVQLKGGFDKFVERALQFCALVGKTDLRQEIKEGLQKDNPKEVPAVKELLNSYYEECRKNNVAFDSVKVDRDIERLAQKFKQESSEEPKSPFESKGVEVILELPLIDDEETEVDALTKTSTKLPVFQHAQNLAVISHDYLIDSYLKYCNEKDMEADSQILEKLSLSQKTREVCEYMQTCFKSDEGIDLEVLLQIESKKNSVEVPQEENSASKKKFKTFKEFVQEVIDSFEEGGNQTSIQKIKKEFQKGKSSQTVTDFISGYLISCQKTDKSFSMDAVDSDLQSMADQFRQESLSDDDSYAFRREDPKNERPEPGPEDWIERYILDCEKNNKEIDMGVIDGFLSRKSP